MKVCVLVHVCLSVCLFWGRKDTRFAVWRDRGQLGFLFMWSLFSLLLFLVLTGNKGAVGVSFMFNGTSFGFVNCHLTSGNEKTTR